MKWKKISTKQLLDHPRHKVFEDVVQLPNGEKSTYLYFGNTPGAVLIIAINKQNKILIQEEYSYPINEWLAQFPGGGVKENETIEEAATREFAEEAGLGGELCKIGWFYTDNRRKKEMMHVFVAKKLYRASGVKDAEEEFRDAWYTKKRVNELIKAGNIVNYTALAAWAIYVNYNC